MSQLPQFLRRLPFVFYGFAALLFAWNLANSWMGLKAMSYPDASFANLETYQKSVALYSAATETIYVAANGALLQILIAIYDKMKGPGE